MYWSYTDRLELWAYLNWCVQYGETFETTAVDHLQKATGKTFSYQQIRNKLRGDWKVRGTCLVFDDLFSQGTAGLYHFEGEEQEHFQQILSRLDPPRIGRWLRSTSAAFTTRSRTLSSTRVTSMRETFAPSPPELDVSKEVQKGSRRKAKQKATLEPKRLEATIHLSEYELAVDEDPYEVKSEAESDLTILSSSKFSDIELDLRPTVPESQEETMPGRPQTLSTTSIEMSLRSAQAELLKEKGVVITLMNQVSELKKELEVLHQSDRAAALNQANPGEQRYISKLRRRLEAQGHLISDFEALETDSLACQKISVKAECNTLYLNIDDTSAIICDLSPNDNLPEQRTNDSALLQGWAMRVHGGNMTSLLEHAQEVRIAKPKLVASLLAAGIFELVLEPAFPEILAIESPLLAQYRKNIANLSQPSPSPCRGGNC
ncbi:hypothetical protein F53441_6781 [Fusarium austroafricanum]|uniref:Uncharacterized protein n=1 Tax=Fusarium austroafricanum TaxID=2364996 RepID=A0A8H4KGI7_9HYPO|nr:hypothetical protein F53441_6781 [Fusarium austroafricanum]